MPITAKLSRKLSETFGEEAAGDMVDWMQRVDAQRAELRDLNELDFARLDARLDRLEERFNQFGREMHAQFAQREAAIVGRLEAKVEQRTADLMNQPSPAPGFPPSVSTPSRSTRRNASPYRAALTGPTPDTRSNSAGVVGRRSIMFQRT